MLVLYFILVFVIGSIAGALGIVYLVDKYVESPNDTDVAANDS